MTSSQSQLRVNGYSNNENTLSAVSNINGGNQKLKSVQLFCRNHPQENCSNYCEETKCFQPLCAECIEEHLMFHKKIGVSEISIKSMRSVRKDCLTKLLKIIDDLLQRLKSLQPPRNPEIIGKQIDDKLEQIKVQIHEMVEQEFSRIRDAARAKINQSLSVIIGMNEIHQNLSKIIDQLSDNYAVIIEGRPSAGTLLPDAIQRTISLNERALIDTFDKESINYVNKMKKIQFEVTHSPDIFLTGLTSCIKISTEQTKTSVQESFSLSHNRSRSKSVNKLQSRSDSDLILSASAKLQSANKILHFFETGSNMLQLFLFDSMRKKRGPVHRSIRLKDFIVPTFHASLLSQQTEYIFISGGIIQLVDSSSKSPMLMRFSLKKEELKKDFARVRERSSHTLCEDPNGECIYILGGYGQGEANDEENASPFETSVERVNITNGKITEETPSKWGGTNIAVATRGHIIKACDEGIEVYNLKTKSWAIAQIKMDKENYIFYRSPGYTLIAQNVLLVYGGYTENEESINKCYHWHIIQDNKGIQVDITKMHCRLPVSEGFYNNPGIVDNKNLFVAQNVDNDDNGCLEDQRKILRFDLGAKEGQWFIVKDIEQQ